jgi:asparagine synthase (glutamine-hydrolysing)
VVPDEWIDRSKQGFQVPMAEWFRTDLRDLARDLLLDPGARSHEYLRRDAVASLLQQHLAGAADNSSLLWSILIFEMWQREVVDGRARARGRHALA